ncbi:MAG: hypothetical protein ACSHYF_13630 [Verrucomicrobiaceae bacterium]
MKLKTIVIPSLACGLFFSLSCGEKKDKTTADGSSATEEVATIVDKVVDAVTPDGGEEAGDVPEVSLEDLAKKTGFAQHLSADVEGYLSIVNASDIYDRVLASKIGQLVKDTLKEDGMDLDEAEDAPEAQMIRAVLGEELFLSFGNNSGNQAVNLNQFSNSSNYHQIKMLVGMMEMQFGGAVDPNAMQAQAMSFLSGLIGDPKAGIGVLEKSSMPPVMLGVKISDEEMRNQIADMVSGQLTELVLEADGFLEDLALEKSGVQLTGFTIAGQTLATLAEENGREEMAQMLGGEEEADRLIKAIAEKNLHVATGSYGDYVIIYVGNAMEDFVLAESISSSFLAEKDAQFLKRYADKEVRLISYAEEEAMDGITGSTKFLGAMLSGLKDGLAEAEAFGDTRDIQTLLEQAVGLEEAMVKMIDYNPYGLVGFIEDGFKMESHGGSNMPSVDFDTTHTFTPVGEGDGVVLFANSTSDPEFSEKLGEYLATLGEATYLVARQIGELDADDNELAEFKEGFALFDQLAAKDLAEIWSALTDDFAAGTGNESAIIVDLNGTLPKVPEVPEVVIKDGKIPRLAIMMPVTDREKVAKSWERINGSAERLLKAVSEAGGPEIPMQEPLESSKDDLTTYFFPIPTVTKDANPNISISDEIFVASTSPKFANELIASVAGGGATKRTGSYIKVNFAELQTFAKYWVELAKNNADTLFEGNESEKDDFLANLPLINQVLEASGELDSLTIYTREAGGEVRSSLHFKTK